MKEIKLTKLKVALVDDEDYEKLSKFNWSLSKGYAKTDKLGLMHRFILGITDRKVFVDHKDRNTLNNTKSNLRIASNSQNQMNREIMITNTSGFRGVYWYSNPLYKHGGRWIARIMKDGKRFSLGCYDTSEEAARAYDSKARELFGEFCGKLNFND